MYIHIHIWLYLVLDFLKKKLGILSLKFSFRQRNWDKTKADQLCKTSKLANFAILPSVKCFYLYFIILEQDGTKEFLFLRILTLFCWNPSFRQIFDPYQPFLATQPDQTLCFLIFSYLWGNFHWSFRIYGSNGTIYQFLKPETNKSG